MILIFMIKPTGPNGNVNFCRRPNKILKFI